MWYEHLLSLDHSLYAYLSLLVTWPYHRTLRYFTLDPAERLAKDLDREDADLENAVNHWRTVKTHECDFIIAASTIAAVANISIFSWSGIEFTYWLATAMIYFSLLLSLWSLITGAQQKSVIHAVPIAHRDPAQNRQTANFILRRPPTRRGSRRTFAELNMLYVWQCPLMLMSYGWAFLLLGITMHVCSPLIERSGPDPRKVAIFYLATGLFLFVNFVWTSAFACWIPRTEPTDRIDGDVELGNYRRFEGNVDSRPSTISGATKVTVWQIEAEDEGKLKMTRSTTF